MYIGDDSIVKSPASPNRTQATIVMTPRTNPNRIMLNTAGCAEIMTLLQ